MIKMGIIYDINLVCGVFVTSLGLTFIIMQGKSKRDKIRLICYCFFTLGGVGLLLWCTRNE